MKKIKIVLAALVLSTFAACDNAIDITQPGELSPEATFQTVADLEKGLWGVYGSMSTINEISFSSIWTDECRIGFANGGQGINDGKYGFILNTNSGDAYSIWQANYTLINFANRIIEAAAKVQSNPQGADKQDANFNSKVEKIVAEARFFRAYAHFKLISYFSTNPADMNALGCIIVKQVPVTTDMLPRSSNADVYKFILEDLDYVTDKGLYFSSAANLNIILTPDAVDAFKARLYLVKGDYANAKTFAKKVYDKFPLTASGFYSKIWEDNIGEADGDEVIFKLNRVRGNAKIGSIWASVDATVSGSPFFAVSTDLFNALNNNDDVRLRSFISTTSDFSDPGKIVISKYPGSENVALLNDEKVFRTSEMLFIYAEAEAEIGSLTEVQRLLQELNDARFEANVPTVALPVSKQAALKAILDERRKELCYEGHRYLDLKRMGARAGISGITRNPQDCAVNGACSLPITDHRFTMPIPNDEIMPNTAIRGQQNPGY